MAKTELTKQSHSIVLVGNFNPPIFQPSWLQLNGMLSESQATEAEIEIIHPQVTVFNLDGVKLQIFSERFSIETTQAKYDEFIRDLLFGIFSLLSHTPLFKMGINRSMEYRLESTETWHKVGHNLAPTDPWKDIFERPGMNSLTMMDEEKHDLDDLVEILKVKVKPSESIKDGIVFEINDHYEIKNREDVSGSSLLLDILEQKWQDSYRRSEDIAKKLLERLL